MRLSLVFLLAAAPAGCGDDLPSFSKVEPDASIECTSPAVGGVDGGRDLDGGSVGGAAAEGEEVPCPAGQVCLNHRCFDACTNDLGCSQAEQCDEGVCVPRTRPRPDGGMRDAGPTDPCEGVHCESPMPACHPQNGACVACLDISQCMVGDVCDVSRGVCRPFAPRPCSPCDTDAQCIDRAGGVVGSCVTLEAAFERVCVPSCAEDETCPTGLACQDGRCLPRVGTCTGFVAAIERRSCSADDDCVPFGSTAAEGQCDVPTPDGGAGTCLQPCGLATDCPADTTCMDGFCRPSPSG